jgi:hypothetical protein
MNWLDHPLHCDCVECVAGDPKYAGKRGTARGLIEQLSRRGVSFRLAGDKVQFRPSALVTDEERSEIRRVRDELHDLLREDDARRHRRDGNVRDQGEVYVRDQGEVFEMAREPAQRGAA